MYVSSTREKIRSICFCVCVTHRHTLIVNLSDKHLDVEMTFERFAKCLYLKCGLGFGLFFSKFSVPFTIYFWPPFFYLSLGFVTFIEPNSCLAASCTRRVGI